MELKHRVLVVDDEPSLRKNICRFLTRRGIEAEEAGDGAEALAVLETRPFDAVITDYQMPGMTGVELTAKICALYPTLTVIAMSSMGEKQAFMAAGAKAFFQKPYELQELLGVLKT
jgi:CheY-like chemotaxis protein